MAPDYNRAMREAFYVLLLANGSFFAWAHWVDRAPRAVASSLDDVPELRLVVPGTTESKVETPSQCFTLGPFTDAVAAATAVGVLTGAGFQPHDRQVDADVADAFLVYVPGLSDAAARRRALATLRSAGVRDAAVVTASDQTDRVSAGVFTQEARAELRAAQVRFAGLDAVVEARQRHISEHWLDFQVHGGAAPPSLSDFGPGPAAQLKLERCAAG
jgi:hypothetical protein